MIDQIAHTLLRNGYHLLDQEVEGLFYRETNDSIYAITLSYSEWIERIDIYRAMQQRMEFRLSTEFGKKVQSLHIVIADNGMFQEKEHQMLEQYENLWLVAEDTGKLYIFERQVADFDNLKSKLENILKGDSKGYKVKKIFHTAPVNVSIVALNVLYFMLVIIVNRDVYAVYDTEVMLSMGAQNYKTFMDGAWYQLVTSLFLHFGLEHLLNNMLLLSYAGYELEKRIGSVSYFVIYFGSGILGNVTSLVYYHGQGSQVVSAGASGAIYGVIGALLILMVVRQIKTPDLSPNRIFIMIALSIYHGLTSTGVDNAAHIGGLVVGIVGGFLLSKISQYGKLE